MRLLLVPRRLEVAWALQAGKYVDKQNTVGASNDNRTFYSTVVRAQTYVTPTLHFLVETSVAQEISDNGSMFRNHWDSVFQSRNGLQDSNGLEFGDSNTRNTWQLKIGPVLNPTGIGIYARPSLRLLYGVQYSSQNNAWGNSFVDSQDQLNVFPSTSDRHWHHVIALEAEAWF
jgi:hypothetical protein